MPLTHALLLSAQPREKPYRLFDQQGLYLEVGPRGSKWWRVKYRFGQRENRLSVGTFPEVSVRAARERCREIRAQVAAGIDPSAERKKAKQRSVRRHETFEVIAREWYGTFAGRLTPGHGDRILRRLESYVFPWIGIDAKPGSSGEFHFVLLYNPHWVIWKLKSRIQTQTFMQMHDRAVDIGATDFNEFSSTASEASEKTAPAASTRGEAP
jgi:Arm DNA-binding domain/Phage integrase central domain